MATFARFAQQEYGTACHHFTTVANKGFENILEIQDFRLTVDQGNHVDAKHRLHTCLCVQIVEHHIADLTASQLYNNTHAIFVRFVTQFSDALDVFLFYQFSNTLNQACLIQLVG